MAAVDGRTLMNANPRRFLTLLAFAVFLPVGTALLFLAAREPVPVPSPSAAVPCSAPVESAAGGRAWYASVAPFEGGADSGRTHVFPRACAGVGAGRPAVVAALAPDLPGVYNIVTRGADEVFVLGGSYGRITRDEGPFVARLDAGTLRTRWRQPLPGIGTGDWNYPGAVGVHANGDVYAIYGRRLLRLDPDSGAVKAQVELPAKQSAVDVAYNGFVVLADGRIAAKSIHRRPGCTAPDFKAFLDCETAGMAASTLVLVEPERLAVEQVLTAPEHVRFRLSVAVLDGTEYLYLPGEERIHRYRYQGGRLSFDAGWQAAYRQPGQTPGTALAALGDWVLIQTNGMPARAPLSIIAISQRDAARQHRIEPFADSSAEGSFIPSMPTVDADNGRVYAVDGYAGRLAALDFDPLRGFAPAWIVPQRSFAFSALVGPPAQRVLVATDLRARLPSLALAHLGFDSKRRLLRHARPVAEDLVWRDAASGRELTRVSNAGAVAGSVPTPGFDGNLFLPDLRRGALLRLAPAP